jgi:hypothetical protein
VSSAPSSSLGARLGAPVDIASLAVFRIGLGAILAWEVVRYFDRGWIARYWIRPEFHFTYYGFHWVRPWPGIGMYVHFAALGVLALGIALGWHYRICAALFAVGFIYVFLLEQATYQNHMYMLCLLGILLPFLPLHRAWSLDAARNPRLRSQIVASWVLWVLRAQIGIVYVFGGIAKLSGDWLRGEPMRMWLAKRTSFPVIGPLFAHEPTVWFFTYGGLLLDLLIVPALLWRPTRPFAFVAAMSFHLLNAQLFQIGIFPWFMLAATGLFFDPGWPRWLCGGKSIAPELRAGRVTEAAWTPRHVFAASLLGLFFGVQILLPFRHHLYPGDVNWTEEGHLFSWHMKLRDKRVVEAEFVLRNGSGDTLRVVEARKILPRWMRNRVMSRPDLVHQLAIALAEHERRRGHRDVRVHALVRGSLNGRAPQLLVDPDVDLAAQPRNLRPAAWILPLRDPTLQGRARSASGSGEQHEGE